MTRRELATVLHALRFYQAFIEGRREAESCDHFAEDNPLDPKQIDALCERLNFKDR